KSSYSKEDKKDRKQKEKKDRKEKPTDKYTNSSDKPEHEPNTESYFVPLPDDDDARGERYRKRRKERRERRKRRKEKRKREKRERRQKRHKRRHRDEYSFLDEFTGTESSSEPLSGQTDTGRPNRERLCHDGRSSQTDEITSESVTIQPE